MATIHASIEIEDGKTIADFQVLKLDGHEFVSKPQVHKMMMAMVKKVIEEGRVLVAPGHEEYFKRLLNGEYTD